MARVDETISAHLAATVGGLVLATNLFNGPIVGGSIEAVFCTLDGGPAPEMQLADTYNKISNVVIAVRAKVQGYGSGLTLAQSVWTALHAQILDSTWVDMLILESEPQYVGEIKAGQHLWQMTAQVEQNATLT